MQENNVIYEITKKIQDKDNIQKDMNQAINLVSDMFKRKYIDKIDKELKNKLQEIEKIPPKEIILLNAIKPFLQKSYHKNIDNTIDVFKTFSILNSFKNNFDNKNDVKNIEVIANNVFFANSIKNTDPSVKDDGVYDIDESCIFGINNIKPLGNEKFFILIMLIMLFINN